MTVCVNVLNSLTSPFQSGCTHFTFAPEVYGWVPAVPRPHQHLGWSGCLMFDIPVGRHIVVLICSFPPSKTGGHLFMYLVTLCMSSLVKCLFQSFRPFLIGFLTSYWVVRILFLFWTQTLYQRYALPVFSPLFNGQCSLCLVLRNLCLPQGHEIFLLFSS